MSETVLKHFTCKNEQWDTSHKHSIIYEGIEWKWIIQTCWLTAYPFEYSGNSPNLYILYQHSTYWIYEFWLILFRDFYAMDFDFNSYIKSHYVHLFTQIISVTHFIDISNTNKWIIQFENITFFVQFRSISFNEIWYRL